MARFVVLGISTILFCGAGTCGTDPLAGAPQHTLFHGMYALMAEDGGPTVRFRIDNNSVIAVEEDGVQKAVTGSSAIQQIPGEIRFFSFTAFMQPFAGRAMEQWTISFSGEQVSSTRYEGTMVFRLTAETREFENHTAQFRRVGD